MVTKLLSLQNAYAYRDGSNLSIAEGIEDQIKYQRRRLGKIINTDTHKGKIVIIGKRKKSEKEGEKDSWENELVLVRGNLRTGVNKKIYGLENDKKALVANPSTGEYFYVSTKDLEGYEFETPDGISPGSQLDAIIKKIEDTQEESRKQAFKTIREKIASGQPIKIGDKTVTIINTDAKGGVDYAVHDEDNSNPQFYHVDSMKQLQESLEKQEQDEANEIANTFRDHASMLVAQQ
ncbi:MAG: hypothetical protein KBS61_09620 [Chryseobacterium sp.]|nr:hypothetical protein [Candidatus Chryseobacterium enterohippi]